MNEQEEADFVARLETLERRVGLDSDGLSVAERLKQLEDSGFVTATLTGAMDSLQGSTDGLTAVLEQVHKNAQALRRLDNKVENRHIEQTLKVEEVADTARFQAALTGDRNRRFTTAVAAVLAVVAGVFGTLGYAKAVHESHDNRSYQHSQALASYARCEATTASNKTAGRTEAATITLVQQLEAAEKTLLSDPTQNVIGKAARQARATAYQSFLDTIMTTFVPPPPNTCQTFLNLANSLK